MKTISGKYYAYPLIRDRQEFSTKSKNFSGIRWEDGDYKIYSYWTVIAQYSDGVWYMNDASYSIETSKHQQEIRWALGHKFLNDNAIHIDYCVRGIQDIRRYINVSGVVQERIARIKREHIEAGDSPYFKEYVSWGGKINDKYSYL